MRRTVGGLIASVVLGVLLVACSSTSSNTTPTTLGPGGSAPAASTPGGSAPGGTAAPPAKLRILVTNDDGVGAAGIDAVVEGLRKLPDTEVVVVAPATNQSSTGGKTTEGALTAADATTASGYPAKAVNGFPADTIAWAIDQHGVANRPDLVVSGINIGQNVGPVTEISGTVGAARAAAKRGIPAVAASQGLAATPDFPSGVKLVVEWVSKHRAELVGSSSSTSTTPGSTVKAATVLSFNIPTCVTGTLHELVEVPTAKDLAGRDISKSDCETPFSGPKDDIDAFIHGYPSLSSVGQAPGSN